MGLCSITLNRFDFRRHRKPMKVVLIGASGMIGSRVLDELLSRGHEVKAVVRDPSKVKAQAGLTVVAGDINDPAAAAVVAGADVVVSAYAPGLETPELLVPATRNLIAGLEQAGVKRLIMVGGAGGLNVAPGIRLIDVPDFPETYRGIAQVHIEAKDLLAASDLEWTSFSPAAIIQPGERTGKFRIDADDLVVDAKGNSNISAEDYAIALVDELERGQFKRQRFTAAY
jgi:hypothetical protein